MFKEVSDRNILRDWCSWYSLHDMETGSWSYLPGHKLVEKFGCRKDIWLYNLQRYWF